MEFGTNKTKQATRILKKDPNDPNANLTMGLFYLKQEDLIRAIPYLEKATIANKKQGNLWYVLANAHRTLNHYNESEDCFKKAVDLEPDNVEYLKNYGLFLHSANRIEDAMTVLKKAAELDSSNYELYNDIGVLCHTIGLYEEAVHYLTSSLEINSHYMLASINLGHAYIALKHLSAAKELIDNLWPMHKQNPELIELKKLHESARLKESADVDIDTNLTFSDQHFQISTLKIIKSFGLRPEMTERVGLSIVIPIFNEKENIPILYERVIDVLSNLHEPYEIIFVDDGSMDGSREALQMIASESPEVKVIQFRRNYGQTAALSAGFKYSQGDIVITLDGDLQNDPADIPRLLEKMSEGYDLVSGWRKHRQDTFVTRKIPSILANRIINKLIEGTGVQLHDYGCTLKAYKQGIVKNIHLYGEMHRFIPVFAAWLGVRVTEIPVKHHPRQFGVAKYDLSRVSRVIFDLIVVRFFSDYMTRPIQFFGKIAKKIAGWSMLFISLLIGLALFTPINISINTILILTALLTFAVLQITSMGLLGEIMMRSYFENQNKDYYVVEKIINGGG
jgi:glycosyltransferase involved in cell wall biosynthesis/Tfp pilus assembly protein PilF